MAKVVMGDTDTKTVTVTPDKNKYVSGLMKKNGRIEEATELDLNKDEIKRAMQSAVVTEGDEVLDERTYNLKEDESAEAGGEEESGEEEETESDEDLEEGSGSGEDGTDDTEDEVQS